MRPARAEREGRARPGLTGAEIYELAAALPGGSVIRRHEGRELVLAFDAPSSHFFHFARGWFDASYRLDASYLRDPHEAAEVLAFALSFSPWVAETEALLRLCGLPTLDQDTYLRVQERHDVFAARRQFLEEARQRLPALRPTVRHATLKEWASLDLAYTHEGLMADPCDPRPIGARGTHSCCVAALHNPAWRPGGVGAPLALHHFQERDTPEHITATLLALRGWMGEAGELRIHLIGGRDAHPELVTNLLLACEALGWQVASLNMGRNGAEHFLLDPFTCALTVVLPRF